MIKKTGKIKVSFGILFAFLLIISAAGCIKKSSSGAENIEATGTKGLTIKILENYPQDNYLVSTGEEPIIVAVEVKNQGTFPQQEDLDKWSDLKTAEVKVSGYDNNIINIPNIPVSNKKIKWDSFPGVSYVNREGGIDIIEFTGNINADKIKVNKYEPTMLATICYPYLTKAGPAVCIDPFPFDSQNEVCEIGSNILKSQGAPVAITRIDEEVSANKIQFRINIKNVGGGEIIKLDSLQKCISPESGGLQKSDFDMVELESVSVGSTQLACGPFVEGSNKIIRLYNGEGIVICALNIARNATSAYITPLNIELRYGYRSTASKKIKISKLIATSTISCTYESGGCKDTNKWCYNGKCEPCSSGVYNCDDIEGCESTSLCETTTTIPSRGEECANYEEVPGVGQSCCSGLVPCSYSNCNGACYYSCPNALCKAPNEVSCSGDNDCLSGNCGGGVCKAVA